MIPDNFDHVVFTSEPTNQALRNNSAINAVLFEGECSQNIKDYTKSLSIKDFVPEGCVDDPYRLVLDIDFNHETSNADHVKKRIAQKFPDHAGRDDFALDVFKTLNQFCAETGYSHIEGSLLVSLPSSRAGIWHRDNETDVRGFKAYVSDGPMIRSNSSIENINLEFNNYGMVDERNLNPEDYCQVQEGQFGIWKGDYHPNPLIHVKPETKPDELRLSMIVNPKEDAQKEMCKSLGLHPEFG